ncbi:uncharacterized protein BDW43DRAFT_281211 [Aspergillus alliaceus]|uniref:uncharacterized protein n=1 Tax=Petromyces alliaceus TaxID=209559 RepID=UPI0012A3CCB1|nr:uncharacterized protein BDW43DRAFT_281211 [Aspergillus alliaceus]KAB8231965.1 hypothetical protein BDW43DRAFT_281211 [Aspergillus alliaceus]
MRSSWCYRLDLLALNLLTCSPLYISHLTAGSSMTTQSQILISPHHSCTPQWLFFRLSGRCPFRTNSPWSASANACG